MRRLRVLTWHVHGNYLYYLSQIPHDVYVLSKPDRPAGYCGRYGHLPWPDNLYDMPIAQVKAQQFDCIIFQTRQHYLEDQYELLSEDQRKLPRIYIEHDPPQEHPTNTKHPVDDTNTLLVHVTPFNQLMWDNGKTPTRVIDHGVMVPQDVRYNGELAKGIVVVNHLQRRGRRLGVDVFEKARSAVDLDLVGMAAEEAGGLGEVIYNDLLAFEARYRFFFNPIRYTSMGLAVCEAMMIGMPVIGLATTEMAMAVQNGISGYVDTNVNKLIEHMQRLLRDPGEAHRLGEGAQRYANERFNIQRFVRDWDEALRFVTT